jgi:flagellin-specific chaperone FliS
MEANDTEYNDDNLSITSDDEEKRLEDVVFGSKDGILKRIKEHNIENRTKKIKKVKEIAEELEERSVVWKDDDDDEV